MNHEKTQKKTGFFVLADSLKLHLNLHGDVNTLEGGFAILAQMISQRKLDGLKTMVYVINKIDANIKLSSYKDLSPQIQAMVFDDDDNPSRHLYRMNMDMVNVFGKLIDRHVKILYVLSESIHIEIESKLPGVSQLPAHFEEIKNLR